MRGGLFLVLAVLLISAHVTAAEPTPAEKAKALHLRLKLVELFGKSWEALEPRAEELKDDAPAAWAEYYAARAAFRKEEGDAKGALADYDRIYSAGETVPGWVEATVEAMEIEYDFSKAAETDEEAYRIIKSAARRVERLGDRDIGSRGRRTAQRVRNRLQELAGQAAREALAAGRLSEAFTLFSENWADLSDEDKEAFRKLEQTTGELKVSHLPVTADDRVVMRPITDAVLTVGGREYKPGDGDRIRTEAGRCRVDVSFTGERVVSAEVLVRSTRETGEGGTIPTVSVPAAVPEGMVYFPGSPERGIGPFFIDRTEVTVAEFRKCYPDYVPPRGRAAAGADEGSLPAHGVTYQQAVAAAGKLGKKLPTLEQWQWVALGGGARKFPWGDQPPSDDLCNMGTRKVQAVGSHPEGATPEGVLDMCGNVWEWLGGECDGGKGPVAGWAIGGGARMTYQKWLENRERDCLRDPRPAGSLYEAAKVDQREYENYHFESSTRWEVGFRCVREL